jgi:hypothetical protein
MAQLSEINFFDPPKMQIEKTWADCKHFLSCSEEYQTGSVVISNGGKRRKIALH